MKTQIHIHGQKPYTKYPFPPSTAASWVLYSQGDWGWKMCPLSWWIELALRPIWLRSFLVTCFDSAPSLHLSFSDWRFRSSYSTSCGWVLLHSRPGWRISFCIPDRFWLNKGSLLRVVLDDVTTWDETSAIYTNGVCPVPSGALTMDGPLPHTAKLALTDLHSCNANFTLDNTWFVNSSSLGPQDIFQVCIIWVHIPVFPLRFRVLLSVSKLKGEGGWQTADMWKSFTFSGLIPRDVTILHRIVSVIWTFVKLLSSKQIFWCAVCLRSFTDWPRPWEQVPIFQLSSSYLDMGLSSCNRKTRKILRNLL
jgi:hypothetical protein